MRALVISGGGSKGAFGGGVAQHLIEERGHHYDLYIGTSTGSLLISHLALGKVQKIKDVYSSVDQDAIFSNCPFTSKKGKNGEMQIGINHFNVLKNFIRGKKTFGDSSNLKNLILKTITREEFEMLKTSGKEVMVTVSNLSLNEVEYKALSECSYEDFCDWVWISCNYIPFMSLARKNGCEYADGGFGSMVPIKEAIDRGAKIVDVIVLETEVTHYNRLPSKNAFALITNLHAYMIDRIEKQNITIGKFAANHQGAIINLYYTPTVLTTNSLVFNKEKMTEWWQHGLDYARKKNEDLSEIKMDE